MAGEQELEWTGEQELEWAGAGARGSVPTQGGSREGDCPDEEDDEDDIGEDCCEVDDLTARLDTLGEWRVVIEGHVEDCKTTLLPD